MKRLLILSVSAGAGHNRAAQALHAEAQQQFPDLHSEFHDALDFTSRLFKTAYSQSYMLMANHTPALWGLLYEQMGKNKERKTLERFVRNYDRLSYKKFIGFVNDFDPDAVLCTHFLPANVILHHRKHWRREIPVGVVVTDYDVHKFWIHPDVALYFAATEEVRWQMLRYNIPEERIFVKGIPIHPVFRQEKNRPALLQQFGLASNLPTLLVMSGGFGLVDLTGVLERVLKLPIPFQVVVIAGKNERLQKRLNEVACRQKQIPVHVYGYVTNIEDFMSVSDLTITKAGGLTISECLVKQLPMVIFSPIPGQEGRNCDYLLEAGAAVKAKNLDVLDFKVQELLLHGEKRKAMKRAAAQIRRPFAAREILRTMLERTKFVDKAEKNG